MVFCQEQVEILGKNCRASVETDNVGWELEESLEGEVCLMIEIKSLSEIEPSACPALDEY